jgi:hypothetical protein
MSSLQVVPPLDVMAGDISEPEEEESNCSSASLELDRAVPRHTLLGRTEFVVNQT